LNQSLEVFLDAGRRQPPDGHGAGGHRFVVKRQLALEAQFEGLPVYPWNGQKRHEGILDHGFQVAPGRQGSGVALQVCFEDMLTITVQIEANVQLPADIPKSKIIVSPHGVVRRDMEGFLRLKLGWKAMPVAVGRRQGIHVFFTVRVVDLSHSGKQAAGPIKAVVESDRIENIAQQPGRGDHHNPLDGLDVHLFYQTGSQFLADRPRTVVQIVAIVQGYRSASVITEQGQVLVQLLQLIQVQGINVQIIT